MLWHRVVAIAREPGWYRDGGIADTVTGRFDAITMVLVLVLLRMERDPVLIARTARLTELFIEDLDGQLREFGIGDPVMSKRMGKLIRHFGGRLDAWRAALADSDEQALIAVVERNMTFSGAGKPEWIAAAMRVLADQLAALDSTSLLAGQITR